MNSNNRILERDEIEDMIGKGGCIVIYDNRVLRLNNWIVRHPGGDKVIYHMVGKDATDEINAYHSDEALNFMKNFQIGKICPNTRWENFLPPIQGGGFHIKEKTNDFNDEKPKEDVVAINEEDYGKAAYEGHYKKEHQKALKLTTGNVAEKISKIKRKVPKTTDEKNIQLGKTKVISDYEKSLKEHDLKKYPSLDDENQLFIINEYKKLYKELLDVGLFNCTYWGYFRECCRYTFLAIMAYYFLNKKLYLLSAIFLGLFWHQFTFSAHDAAHLAITHNYYIDNLIGILIGDFIGGLSIGWWKRNHNVHHIVTNDPVHDPDIQHIPLFAVSSRLLGSVFSTYYERLLSFDSIANFFISIQQYTYYPILCLGRFNLYRLSWEYLLLNLGPRKGKAAWMRYLEIIGMSFFFYWYGYKLVYCSLPSGWVRFYYVMISHIVTMPIHVQITLSHFAMSTADLGLSECFPQRQLRTTMDVDCPAWLDFIHGGLQFQAVHHLFPRMPRHNFREAQKYVIQFAKKVGIEYKVFGFVEGNLDVINKLGDISKQASIMSECTKHLMNETKESASSFIPSAIREKHEISKNHDEPKSDIEH